MSGLQHLEDAYKQIAAAKDAAAKQDAQVRLPKPAAVTPGVVLHHLMRTLGLERVAHACEHTAAQEAAARELTDRKAVQVCPLLWCACLP